MASGIKTVLLSESGKQFYVTVVADTSSVLTFDLINFELVIITADAVVATTFLPKLNLLGVG